MTTYDLFAIARVVLSLGLAGVVLLLAGQRVPHRWMRPVAAGAVAAGLLAYPNFGAFHPTQIGRVIHYWDAFHYFMGAKYLPELGYSRLYEAVVVAGRELGAFQGVSHVRDLTTYGMRETTTIDAVAVRGRFAPSRWRAFKSDLAFFGGHIREWPGPLLDHGYNDPPPRALLLHLIVRWVPANRATLILLTSLDYVLLLGILLAMWRAFGFLPAALAFSFLTLSFFARFDYIGGSILRWDWVAALLIGVAAFARNAGPASGLLFGYAALARLFPALLLLPLAVKWVQGRVSGRKDPALDRGLVSAAVLVVVAVALVLVLAPPGLLNEYAAKIRLHREEINSNSVGLGSLIVFNSAPWSLDPHGVALLDPAAALAARPAPWLLPLATLLCLAVSVPLILRARALESMMYGVPLIYCAFSPSGYYYSFLVLLVLLPWNGARVSAISLLTMALLATMTATLFAFDFTATGMLPLFNAAAIQLALFFVLWLVFEYVRLYLGPGRVLSLDDPEGSRAAGGAEPGDVARPHAPIDPGPLGATRG